MLDASANQTVTSHAASGRRNSASGESKAAAKSGQGKQADTGLRGRRALAGKAVGQEGSVSPRQTGRTGTPVAGVAAARGAGFARVWSPSRGASKTRSATRPKKAERRGTGPDAQRPGDGSKSGRPLRIHSKRESLKWSFGGLTISVRMLVSLVVVGIVAVTLVPLGLQWAKQEQEYRSVVAEVDAAQQRVTELREELAAWDDESFIAAAARERLGYVRPGATQFVVTDAPAAEAEDDEASRNNLMGPPKPWMWNLSESLEYVDSPPASTGLSAPATQVEEEASGQSAPGE